MGIGKKELDTRFNPQNSRGADVQSVHDEVDKIVRVFAGKLDKLLVGTGRNVSLTFTALEDVAHRAHAAVRHGEHRGVDSGATEASTTDAARAPRKAVAPKASAPKEAVAGKIDGRSKEARAAKAAAAAAAAQETDETVPEAVVTPIRRQARRPSA